MGLLSIETKAWYGISYNPMQLWTLKYLIKKLKLWTHRRLRWIKHRELHSCVSNQRRANVDNHSKAVLCLRSRPVKDEEAGPLALRRRWGWETQCKNRTVLYSHGEGAWGGRHSPQVRSLHLMDTRGSREWAAKTVSKTAWTDREQAGREKERHTKFKQNLNERVTKQWMKRKGKPSQPQKESKKPVIATKPTGHMAGPGLRQAADWGARQGACSCCRSAVLRGAAGTTVLSGSRSHRASICACAQTHTHTHTHTQVVGWPRRLICQQNQGKLNRLTNSPHESRALLKCSCQKKNHPEQSHPTKTLRSYQESLISSQRCCNSTDTLGSGVKP